MILYPTIELQNGRCVSLKRGRLDAPHIWHVDPVVAARGFAAAGADWMHLTDFDAVAGDPGNTDLVVDIVRHAGIPVQLGGGLRSADAISRWLDAGVGRVVVGTLAVRSPDVVKALAKYHPDQIVLAVDVYRGRVVTDGWREETAFTPDDFIAAFAADPLAAIVVTDVDADIGEAEAPLALVSRLGGIARAPMIASGMTRSLDDIARLKYIPHISGAIIGRALFDRSVTLADALEAASPERELVAPFV